MSSALLLPPTSTSPQTALQLTRQAPSFFASQSGWLSFLPYPLSLFINTESQEKWQIYENILITSLRTGDNKTAHQCLTTLTDRFGKANDRVMALHGLYREATAKDEKALLEVMKTYEDVLKEDPSCFSIRKRRAALLRSMGKTSEAITALTSMLDTSPVDAECWAELADVYVSQGAYDQAVFCLEEVLLVTPNAWNMHARLAEVLLMSAGRTESGSGAQLGALAESMRRSARSVELCDYYLRGLYGLRLSTLRLLDLMDADSKKSQQAHAVSSTGDLPLPSIETIRKLSNAAGEKLREILTRSSSGDPEWDGYDPAELAAARELLDKRADK